MVILKKSLILILFLNITAVAAINLQRYSINTYTNTNSVEQNPINLNLSNSSITNLYALRVGFRQFSNPTINSSSTLSLDNRLSITDSIMADINGDPLLYPNPLQLNESAKLGYWLSQSTNVNIQIYDIFGHQMFSQSLSSGMSGARYGYNLLTINAATFNYFDLSAGVYFLFIFDETNNMIGKTKFSIIP